MPDPSNSLSRDLACLTVLATCFALPLVNPLSPNSAPRQQLRDLSRALLKATAVALGSVGVVVLGGGALLVGEKVWRSASRWWTAGTRQGSDRGERGNP
ncbi:hypothetical protein JCM21900_001127 [Sporobolomyces salmonicolor]